ncbi:RNA polymerase factor sigma-54 [Persicobacter diffluens]|uniref:RNA polymerase sigma-54 factor n=1 Tax=Persicobacter diffluens TaxID=981 RepID=A0AAN5AKP6_9BACT|nr:RNA polymerase sigma-54 factor [Persicobacter diffluens]
MQKLGLTQTLSQKLSPQQIQFIKLLQVPTAELEARVEEELEANPALEEGRDDAEDPYAQQDDFEASEGSDEYMDNEISVEEYLHDDFSGYKMYGDGSGDEEEKDIPISSMTTLQEQLKDQLSFLPLNDHQKLLGEQLIGSIENDGYIRRDLEMIVNDLAFSRNIETNLEELESVLVQIQQFDPAGIAARDLQECLLLQLKRRQDPDEATEDAIRIMEECFNDFTKKHYEKIMRRLNIKEEDRLREAFETIVRLNPKPGGITEGLVKNQYLIPDFILTNDNGKLDLSLNSKNAPDLKVSRSYAEMMDAYDKSDKKDKNLRDTVMFVKQKLDAAKWFIDAIRQRQETLLNTMGCILVHQNEFFLTGDEAKLRPMILKDIADKIEMDISTVSRVANSKAIQTEFGIFPLKYFFSEGITTDTGEDVSSREVKHVLKGLIDEEDKKKPLSDDKLEKLLKDKGYKIARRTVAKYREQLNIPVARLRKQI